MNSNTVKKTLLLFFLTIIIFTSGCVSLEVEQKIHRNGLSEIKTTLDMSSLYTNPDVEEDIPDINEALTDFCENFLDGTTLSSPYCTPYPNEYKVISGGSFSLQDDPSFKFDGTVYRYDIKGIQNILSEATKSQGQEITFEDVEQIKSVTSMMGIEINYIVEMPGIITKADVGEINGNRVTINFFDLYETDHIYIESKDDGNITGMFLSSATTIGVVVFVIILIGLFIFYRKNKKRKYGGYDINKLKKGLR